MSDLSPSDEEKKHGLPYETKDGNEVDVEVVPLYDDAGPVEFAEKKE